MTKSPPKIIFSQDKDDTGRYAGDVAGAEITWCEDPINENDEKYIRFDLIEPLLSGTEGQFTKLFEFAKVAIEMQDLLGDRDSGIRINAKTSSKEAMQLVVSISQRMWVLRENLEF